MCGEEVIVCDEGGDCVSGEGVIVFASVLQRIQGLEKCTRLKKLCLYQNHIAKIEGLEELHLLSTLWLNSNKITTIEVRML